MRHSRIAMAGLLGIVALFALTIAVLLEATDGWDSGVCKGNSVSKVTRCQF